MAEIRKIGTVVQTKATLVLDDEEIAALDALVGYGLKWFLEVFYEKLGRAYLQPHENGLKRLFEAVAGCKHMTEAASECRQFLALCEADRRDTSDVIRSTNWKLRYEQNGAKRG